MDVIIRTVNTGEEDLFWELLNQLDGETSFMMYEPGERKKKPDGLRQMIEASVNGGDLLLVAESEGTLQGFLSANRGGPSRVHHSAYVVIGIRSAFRGRGIGTQFFTFMEEWAQNQGITRLELTVMCLNKGAVALYEKFGFLIEGTKQSSMYVDGHYADEYYMAKLLGAARKMDITEEENNGCGFRNRVEKQK